MRMTDLIAKKRDGGRLSPAEMAFFISGAADGSIPDYQLSALLMAIFLRGMDADETTDMTLKMAASGSMLDLSALGEKTVDKHSTGGVGDKTTLIVAPVAAALGCTVAKMSGRGLGHTGGTIDKLESIPGFRTALSPEEFIRNAERIGVCVVGQSGNLAPADKRLYALRDVTATVDSLPLIAASIMSKKIAAGAKNIVLDVKYGSGAFMKTPKQAEMLAEKMIEIGKGAGRNMTAVLSDMDVPLGFAVGNALEVTEAARVLQGGGAADLTEVCTVLATQMVRLCNGGSEAECRAAVVGAMRDGSAFRKLCEMVSAQGGDAAVLSDTSRCFAQPQSQRTVFAEQSGYILSTDSARIGEAAVVSGAGRATKADSIDPAAGIVLQKKMGDFVTKGEPLAVLYGAENRLTEAEQVLQSAYRFGEEKPDALPLIAKILC